MKKTKFVPAFFEKFVDYGQNRLEWVNHLRFRGFHVSLMSQGWLFHLKHTQSASAAKQPLRAVNEKIEKIREAEEFEKYRGEWMVPVCGQTEESHPNPVGMTVEEFLEKQTQSQAQSPKTKRLSRDQELAEKFAKKREYMKRKKMYE